MSFDLVIAAARVAGHADPIDIGITGGRITAIGPGLETSGPREDAGGNFAFSGFVEAHIHLDKADILDRCPICEGTLTEAVRLTASAKAGFTVEDVYRRAAGIVESAILHGTTRMRSFVEIDPRAGLRSFQALLELRKDYAFAIDIELCAFAQEGLTNEPETEVLLDWALANGADLVGGCPYTDPDPRMHISRIFDLAERHGVDIDFHIDFDLDPENSSLPEVIAQTRARNYGGRVTVGHATKLSAMAPTDAADLLTQMADAGIGLVVLPATDLFLLGRAADRLVPRGVAPARQASLLGVTAAIATNNVLNPFTPYGDVSLLRAANLYANVAQLSGEADLLDIFDMVGRHPAALLGVEHGLVKGGPADIVLLDAPDAVTALRTIAPARAGWKRGRKTFSRPAAMLLR